MTPANALDLTGQRFGRLTVIALCGLTSSGNRTWRVRCDCGAEKEVPAGRLRRGEARSCGCWGRHLSRERIAAHNPARVGHGHTRHRRRSPTYHSWHAMRARCMNPAAMYYADYGGRGITVCDRWRDSFAAFLGDMGERPADRTLDRIDPDGHYEPGNCRWATLKEQRANRRHARPAA